MEFICAEEFLKESKAIQKVFIEWWKPSKHDIVILNYNYVETTIREIDNEDGDLKSLVYTENLLKGYWKVACKIALEVTNEG